MLCLYNTLTRSKTVFTSLKKNVVTLYSCGPTVYHEVHLGNYRTFITTDILRRALIFFGYQVDHIMNITDVGHLTSDNDSGEDKMAVGAARENKSARAIARKYEKIFRSEYRALGCLPPRRWTRATEHIAEQITLIKKLERAGVTYKTDDGLYFDSTMFAPYGALCGTAAHTKGQRAGARIALGSKKHPTDFALWKFSVRGTKRQMEWKSPWGVGFPGWHIECSAMAMAYLGPTVDIHTGGTDLIPIHHTNEIAQSEMATGKPFVRYWVHGAFLLERDKKMSKSSGEFKTVQWLRDHHFNPLDYRYLTLQTHYRKELNFSGDALAAAARARAQLCELVIAAPRRGRALQGWLEKFHAALADDINMPKALASLWDMVGSKEQKDAIRATLLVMDQVLRIGLIGARKKKVTIPAATKKLLAARTAARLAEQWALSDDLRKKIHAQGFEVIDTVEGQKVRPLP